MKKMIAVLLATFMLVAPSVFAAGSSESASSDSRKGGQVELNLWHKWSGTNAEYLQQVVAAFMAKNPDVKMNVVSKPGEYIKLLQAMIADLAAGNKPPEIFIGGYNMLEYIASELNPTELKDLAPSAEALAELKSRFDDTVYNIVNIGGKQIGLPFALSNMVLYVNMDIFKAAGLSEKDIPTTWAEVEKVGELINQKTGKWAVGFDVIDTWSDCTLIYSAGGTMKTPDNKKVNFTNPGAIQALTMWQNFANKGLLPRSTQAEIDADFAAGNMAMRPTTTMKIASYREQANFELRTVKLPNFTGKRNQLAAGGAAAISFAKDKAKKDAVWKFMEFVASKEGMDIFTKTGYLCVTKDEVEIAPYQQAAYDQRPLAIIWANWPSGAAGLEMERLFLDARNRILLQNVPVEATLRDVENACNKLLN